MDTKKHHTHLSLEERRQIYLLLGRKTPVCEIAALLGRHHSTVYREIQRNGFWDEEDHKNNGYYPLNAQEYYRRRRQSLRLFERYPALKEFVVEKLKAYWSPDQIAGYLKRLGLASFYACMETIYRFVYSAEGHELGLYRYLFKGRHRRRRKFGRVPRDTRIPEHHGIAFRPEIVSSRETFGHWETDLLIFNREHGKANLTSMSERKSRYTILLKNEDRRPFPVMSRIRDRLARLPDDLSQTMTFDWGFEFMRYPLLRQDLGMESYFCDPQAPWQKGTVESNNNRIRRFFSREINLQAVNDADLYAVCVIMNSTPRRCLDYRTPQEVLDAHLQTAA
ncbi:IS30 family transposase [Planctomicrobium sp. SH664]|uniref:IS30 family transposase n=1 Tax=Planctomicrobium sp. SH664 TaxID=3448125 RepID=UPI003F5BB3E5